MKLKQNFKYLLFISISVIVGLFTTVNVSLADGDTWTKKANMPTPRWNPETAVVNG